ncbi:MAG: class I SAM-dependent methyltransferase [Candidatus Latescibacteria bacterium]|nr:class I SAM-dependent methyltransferase [Candidatus Latescibacterota bacterium]
MSRRDHWEKVYRSKHETDVSWYRPHLERSLEMILRSGVGLDARILDVGGGASTLVDDLLTHGFRRVMVVDIAQAPLEAAQKRLGDRARDVEWLVGDITKLDLPPNSIDVWHDRAGFHFLTSETDRKAYIERVCRAVKPGGFVVLATFGPEGPERCSGLPVIRYSPDALHAEFGDTFRMVEHLGETHRTPWGTDQEFVYCMCVRESECRPAT